MVCPWLSRRSAAPRPPNHHPPRLSGRMILSVDKLGAQEHDNLSDPRPTQMAVFAADQVVLLDAGSVVCRKACISWSEQRRRLHFAYYVAHLQFTPLSGVGSLPCLAQKVSDIFAG